MKTIRSKKKPDEQQSSARPVNGIGLFIILCLLAIALLFYRESLYEIWGGIRQITIHDLAYCILFAVAAYFMEGMTIACMMSMVIPGFPVKKGTGIAYLCEFYRLITLGNGSGFAEIYYLHKSGIETGTATVLTMHQYLCKRIAIMFLGGLGFVILSLDRQKQGFYGNYVGFMVTGGLICLAVIAFFLCLTLSARVTTVICAAVDRLATKFPSYGEKLCVWKEQAALLNQSGRIILRQNRKIIAAILIQIGKLLLFYAIPAYLLKGNSRLATVDCICLMAVTYMLSGVIPTPSGVGSLEFVFLLFFTEFMEAQAAIPAILVFRFATWVIPFLIGGIVNIFYRKQSD